MYLLYSLLLTLGFIILLPRFILDAFRSGKYVTGLGQRLGNLPLLKHNQESIIWLHCVSVGEARAAQSLARALCERFPAATLVVSTTTVTGQKVARDVFGKHARAVFYFPIDWAWTVRRALRAIKPSAVLIMETELWPRMFRECRKQEIPIALVNGRISDKSFRRYKLIPSFIRRVLNDLTLAMMQSAEDADRIRDLGLAGAKIIVSGNLKFDSASSAPNAELAAALRERFGFDQKRPLIVAASTHAPEEAMVIKAFKTLRQAQPGTRLLIAPRHPERFGEVADLLQGSNLSWSRRSGPRTSDDETSEVILLDSIGELGAVFSLAQLVFVGGSLTPHGGHNVLEPSAQGVCTITGPFTHNFAAITETMLDENALIQLPESSDLAAELASVFTQLLADKTRRLEIGARARLVCQRNQGTTERTVEMIAQILATPSADGRTLQFSTLGATPAK
jgi:3-deoxy-D-manno-octulosonic-acid transferase